MTTCRTTLAQTAAFALLVSGLTVLGAGPAAAATGCSSGVPGDVNGDGYAEVAVRSRKPEAVHVFYGHPSGLQVDARGRALDDQVFTQDTRGIPGSSDNRHHFGRTTAFADVNADGCADLAIGAYGDGLGSLTVLYGSPKGLSTEHVQRIRLEQTPLADQPHGLEGGDFGYSLAGGDLTGDGIDDLAVGAPSAVGCANDSGCGAALVFSGSRDRLSARGVTILRGDERLLKVSFGAALAIGDFDGDRRAELAVAAPWHYPIAVYHFGPDGVLPERTQQLAGDSEGVPSAAQFGNLGQLVAAGDVDGDGRDELAASVTGSESPDAVLVFRGSEDGLTGVDSQLLTTTAFGLTTEPVEHCLTGLAMGRLDAGATDDLVVGLPCATNSRVAAGAVAVAFGGTGGLSTSRVLRLHEAVRGVPGSAEKGDAFGSSLTTAYAQDGQQASLIVGSEGENVGKAKGAGRVYQFPRSAAGPQAKGSRTFSLATRGVKGSARTNGLLGRGMNTP